MRVCSQAIDSAAQGIIAGAYDVAIAGGVEMMSVVPMKMNRMGKDSEGPIFRERYPDGLVHQGIAAERIAARWQLGREVNRFSLMSHHKAAADQEAVKKDIVPIRLSDGGLVDRDEG